MYVQLLKIFKYLKEEKQRINGQKIVCLFLIQLFRSFQCFMLRTWEEGERVLEVVSHNSTVNVDMRFTIEE